MNDSVALETPIEIINIVPYNPLISKCQIKVCWVGDEPNPNKSIITKDTAYELANTLPGSPIVGHYNENTQDFEQHNKLIEIRDGKVSLRPDTQPYGFVDLGAKVWFQKFNDNGIVREYLVTEGWLWTGQYPECKRIIQKGNNQSMELDEDIIDAYWTKDIKGNKEFFIINEAIISKLCILGEDYKPCFEGASITAPKVEFSLGEDFKQQVLFMMNEIKNILNEGGTSEMNDDKVIALGAEEPVIEEPVVVEEPADPTPVVGSEFIEDNDEDDNDEEKCLKCGKPIDECECDEDKKDEYNLNEIPEYMELQSQYSELETQLNEAKTALELLKAENEGLSQFKAAIEKKEKEAMIEQFYMLSDEDKKDVVDNIDTYSLDEIEAKLSVICVRNKVSFSENLDNNTQDPVVYSLTNAGLDADGTPDWIKAIQEVAKDY